MPSTGALIEQFALLESRRLNRPALDQWAGSVLSQLQGLLQHSPEAWARIGDCMNLAALIEVYRGELAGARQMCETHLRWAGALTREHGVLAASDLAIQPWLNVGRLLCMGGDFPGARERFALFLDHHAGRPVRMAEIHIPPEAWKDIVQAQPLVEDVLGVVYLVDSLKTFFAARDAEGARDFIRRCREAGIGHVQPYLEEGEVVALASLGRVPEALEVTMRPAWAAQGYSKLVAAAYRAALLLAKDETGHARTVLTAIAKRSLGSRLEQVQDQRVLRLLLFLGTLCQQAGMLEEAAGFLRMGLEATRTFDDELLRVRFLDRLLGLDGLSDRDALHQAREQLQRQSFYAPLRSSARAPFPAPEPPPVFGALRQAIANLATVS